MRLRLRRRACRRDGGVVLAQGVIPRAFSPPLSLNAWRKSPLRRPIVMAFLRDSFMCLPCMVCCKQTESGAVEVHECESAHNSAGL